jgi:hypothetical protein
MSKPPPAGRRIALLALALLAGCTTLQSGLTIGPGEQFVLGGAQRGAYRVEARNVGDVPVDVAEVRAPGDTVALGALAPGARQSLRFGAGAAALLINPTDRPALLRLSVSGDTNLGMRYEATRR